MPKIHREDLEQDTTPTSNVAFNAVVQALTTEPEPEPEPHTLPPPPEPEPSTLPPPPPSPNPETTCCGGAQPPCVPLSLQTVLIGVAVAYLVGLATGACIFSGVRLPDLE